MLAKSYAQKVYRKVFDDVPNNLITKKMTLKMHTKKENHSQFLVLFSTRRLLARILTNIDSFKKQYRKMLYLGGQKFYSGTPLPLHFVFLDRQKGEEIFKKLS